MTREVRGTIRSRTASATALATIALATGGFVISSGSISKPAVGGQTSATTRP